MALLVSGVSLGYFEIDTLFRHPSRRNRNVNLGRNIYVDKNLSLHCADDMNTLAEGKQKKRKKGSRTKLVTLIF
jgi:hypothetical protein